MSFGFGKSIITPMVSFLSGLNTVLSRRDRLKVGKVVVMVESFSCPPQYWMTTVIQPWA